MLVAGREFEEVWVVDFEFGAGDGERLDPVCLVAREVGSGTELRCWQDDLRKMRVPPYAIGDNALFVAYFASAELLCHRVLRWAPPSNVLDLYVEFRALTNGRCLAAGTGLLGALTHFGLDAIGTQEKDEMRQLVLSGGPWSVDQRHDILDYCGSDVDATARLLKAMEPTIDLPRALLRGRYMRAVAAVEDVGTPIDVSTLAKLRGVWVDIQDSLIREVDAQYCVYDGGTFKADRFAAYLARHGIAWPRLESGRLALDDDTFRDMARTHPQLTSLRELRSALGQMRLASLAVGSDGRNRCLLSPFASRTGRNQPSNARFIFGPSTWMRGLICPEPGYALAYIDWSQQEFGIAAALSGDPFMQAAYQSGDPYLEFAKQAGAAPRTATKHSHADVRDQFKACVLAVQYGMGEDSLAVRINQPACHARELLRLHHQTYRSFWKWSDAALDYAMLNGRIHTVFGWPLHVESDANPRSLRNFPMQANGAEMLRIACCSITERNIRLCAPVHDALLIESPVSELAATVAEVQELMAQASAEVLGGFRLRSEAKLVLYPDRYMDERGANMWDTALRLAEEALAARQTNLRQRASPGLSISSYI